MRKKILIAFSAMFILGVAMAVFAFQNGTKAVFSPTQNIAVSSENDSCGMADCCKDGVCPMKGVCCKNGDSCPLKDTETASVDLQNVVVATGESCCQKGASCCKGGACCKSKSN